MTAYNDQDSDPMRFDDPDWLAERRVSFNGIAIPIEVEPEEDEDNGVTLSPVQREAVRLALTLPPDVLEAAAPAVVQNYEVYREMLGDEELPPLQAPVDVWQRLTPSYLQIPMHDSVATPTFFLLAECDWDPEHGLVVRSRNGHADASSQQGELSLEN